MLLLSVDSFRDTLSAYPAIVSLVRIGVVETHYYQQFPLVSRPDLEEVHQFERIAIRRMQGLELPQKLRRAP